MWWWAEVSAVGGGNHLFAGSARLRAVDGSAGAGHVALDRPGDLLDGPSVDHFSGHRKNETLIDALVDRSMSRSR